MIRINDSKSKTSLKAAALLSVFLLFAAATGFGQQQVNLTAGFTTTTLPDGTVQPMWGYNCQALATTVTSSATCAPLTGTSSLAATPGQLGGFYVVNGGSGYSATPTVTITPAAGNTPTTAATATAIVSGGVIVGFNMTSHGAGYTAAPSVTIKDATGTGAVAAAGLAWSPVLITVPMGAAGGLQINLTNQLQFATSSTPNNIPTSIVIIGQVGGGLGGVPTTTASPSHANAQGCPTWFIASGATPPGTPCPGPQKGASGTPPVQGPRVQSMSTEVAAAAPGTTTSTSLNWPLLKPGTYLLESGTHPSIQVPMGLIGVLVVTAAPGSAAATGLTTGCAYGYTAATTGATTTPASCAVPYNSEVPLEFSEIDPVQNKEVDQAVRTAGFSETAVWSKMTPVGGGAITGVAVTAGGSGYSYPVSVSFTPTGTTGAGATASATLSFGVAGLTLGNGGTGYTAPTVSLVGGGGSGATATITQTGGVVTLSLTAAGSGYISAPEVVITDPIGTGASATATLATTGSVAGISLGAAGAGYTTAPTVNISGGTGTGASATASTAAGGCGTVHTCYPPAVNYTPLYYLINGQAFDKTNSGRSLFAATAGITTTVPPSPVTTGITGTVLVRLVNAGLRMHTPSIVGSTTTGFNGAGATATVGGFDLIAEDGNVIPNVSATATMPFPAAPKVQTDVLMVPSKVYDVLINVPAAGTSASAPAPIPVYARDLALSANSSQRDAGALAYIGVNGAVLPNTGVNAFAGAAVAVADVYNSVAPCAAATVLGACAPFTVTDVSKGVIANDSNVYGVELSSPPTAGTVSCPAWGTVLGTTVQGICPNGTFSYTPNPGIGVGSTAGAVLDTFNYCANGAAPGTANLCTSVTLGTSSVYGTLPTAGNISFKANTASFVKILPPGVLAAASDAKNLPLSVVVSSITPASGLTIVMDPQGGFTAQLALPATAASTATFTYQVQNSLGEQSTTAGTVTINFPAPSNLVVNVVDAQAYNNCNGNSTCIAGLTKITDYRWIIEEDRTFWVDPSCTTNTNALSPGNGCPQVVGAGLGGTIPTFGANFHTSAMPFVAQGCTGEQSCEFGQTMLDTNPASSTYGTHIPAVCDLGFGACRPDLGNGTTSGGYAWVNPSQVPLDPAKRYYISILPGDAANPFPAYAGNSNCVANTTGGGYQNNGQCGHTMSGAPIPPSCNVLLNTSGSSVCTSTTTPAFKPVTVLALPTPLPTGNLSVIVFEDDFPLNGEQDGGGGNGTVAPIEPGLGGFNLVLWDTYGGLGDVTGQDTYDMFNQPLTNSLAGFIDPSTGIDACPISATPNVATGAGGPQITGNGAGPAPASGMTSMIVTCPKYEADGITLSPLAGQAVITNLMPEKFSVQAYPGADRIARGEEWLQTNTLDGQHPHDSFIRIGEPSYFQEYGPAGYHVAIGFANPAIINGRHNDVCAGNGTPGTVGPCTNTIDGQVDVQRISRTPDQRLYPSGSRDALAWTQCWVSLGDPDGEDFMFTKCDANGNFRFTGVPGGNWRLTIGDQWNDQIIDGLSTPADVGCLSAAPNSPTNPTTCPGNQTLHMGSVGVQQWQSNLYTRTFIDDNKNGIWDAGEIGIPFIYTRIRYRDGHNANGLVTDFNGVANFNEAYPLFNWYVVQSDSTRYKTTGVHVVYDAAGPADGSPSCGSSARPCGTSTAYNFLSNTYESVPLPADLSVPGAVYCAKADCIAEANGDYLTGKAVASSSAASTGRIDPPYYWGGFEGWAGLTSHSNWIDFGKAPYASCPPACASVPAFTQNATGGGVTATTANVGENGGINGWVEYASTRPFDQADQMIEQPWEPNVPGVTLNLYQEGFAADGVTPTLTLVDTTVTTSWDAWAQGFYPGSTAGSGQMKPYMNCPGQGLASPATTPNQDLFFLTLQNQPFFLDWYNTLHTTGTPSPSLLPYSSQYKCYDSMHIGNQIQPAPYDGHYQFPSILGLDPTTGKQITPTGYMNPITGVAPTTTGTNCTVCVKNPDSTDPYRVGTPMLPPGKYVVEVVVPPGFEVYKEEDKNLLIGDNYIAPVTQQFGGLGTDIFIIPDQASIASLYDESGAGYNSTNYQDQTTAMGLNDELSGVPGYPGFTDHVWPCVGEQRVVPDFLSLFPQAKEVAPFAGATRPICNRKEVNVETQASTSVKFSIFTSTHIASKFTGGITDDFTSEFDPFSPQFGEKFAPPNMPISTKDYLGNEISRVYSDHWGAYNGLTYSSWEVNPPNITGYSPTIMVQCMNDPGPILDTRATIPNPNGTGSIANPTYGQMITDPLFNPAYSNFCYELPYMPGLTTYTDTPVVPTQAFVGAGYNNVDCSYPDATPAIAEVDGDQIGPWVAAAGSSLTITALGNQQVNNYAYSGPSASVAPFNMKTVNRHYGFGATQCTAVSATCAAVSGVTIGGLAAPITSWNDTQIVVSVPAGVAACPIQQQAQYGGSPASCGQLVITAGNGKQSIDTVTVTIGGSMPKHVSAQSSVQAAIDLANPGDLLMIDPTCTTGTGTTQTTTGCTSTTPAANRSGSSHQEMLIMWKPVRLQGVGAASSVINANAQPAGKLLDPWRRHINCLFGLTLQGVPTTAKSGAGSFDPTNSYSCPDSDSGTPWTNWVGAPNSPQIDRLPLEATVGWDATQNGNLAEQLQEPSLMGAYEGAGITVLGKGLEFYGQNPWTDGNEGGAFPTGTTLLTGVGPNPTALFTGDLSTYCHTVNYTTVPPSVSSATNPYPSNFMCNPSSIDGLTITNSSQGGGGIFIHGWAHHLQVANDRIYNNSGTLTGGINVGQGEFPTPVVQGSTTNSPPGSCSDGTGYVNNQHLPYCLQIEVNVHNNYITNNSSLGDELFSGTLSGGGGVTFCTGNDYYLFNYNWVCGNLSSGEGGGLVHLGEIQNGDIEHNSIVFNQSQNPTIPTNGGGIQVMGTPDTDPTCGTSIDADCPPGLSDGTGHGLVINANLIQGNMAESGSGGGIRLQQVNGTEVSTFPGVYPITAASEGHTVTITTPRTATLPSALGDSVTIAGVSVAGYNGTFLVTGLGTRSFTYFDPTAGMAAGAGGTFTDTTAAGTAQTITTARETGSGVVTITSTLSPSVGDTVVISGVTPTGYNGTYIVTGVPAAGTFTYNDRASLGAGTAFGTVTDSSQSSAALWNGVIITNNIIVNNVAGWDGGGISLQDALNVQIINNTIAQNDSIASSGVLTQSIGAPDSSAPPGTCTNGAATASCPQIAGLASTPNSGLLTTTFTGLTLTCPYVRTGGGGGGGSQPNQCQSFSDPYILNNLIWHNRSYDIGITGSGTGNLNQQNLVALFTATGATPPSQTSTGQCSSTEVYWDLGIRGEALGSTTALFSSHTMTSGGGGGGGGGGSPFVSSYCNGSRVPAECTVADGCAGPTGYGVPPGIVDAATPNPRFTLNPNATVDEGNNWINVSWGPLSLTNPSNPGPTTSAGTGNYGGGLPLGNYALQPGSEAINNISYPENLPAGIVVPTTDFFGNPRPESSTDNRIDNGAVEFQGTPGTTGNTPTLSAISPNSGTQGSTVSVILTGTNLTGTNAVTVSGTGITVTGIDVVSATQVDAVFTIAASASGTARTVTVTTPVGTSGGVTFTVGALTPTLMSINPTSGLRGTTVNPLTLTGTNLAGTTAVTISNGPGGGGANAITCTIVAPAPTATTVNASCVIPATAPATARNLTVTAGGVVSNAETFTVTAAAVPLSITPTTWNFGTQPVAGTGGSNHTFTVTGTPGAAISFSITGTNPGDFTRRTGGGAGSCGATLPNSGTCTYGVHFKPLAPVAPTARSASLNVTSGASTVSATLTGTSR